MNDDLYKIGLACIGFLLTAIGSFIAWLAKHLISDVNSIKLDVNSIKSDIEHLLDVKTKVEENHDKLVELSIDVSKNTKDLICYHEKMRDVEQRLASGMK